MIQALPVPASLLGESPFWHPDEAALYWCDIPGRRLNRWHPASAGHRHWEFDTEPACCAPVLGGGLPEFSFNLIDDGLVGQQVFAGEATRLAYMTDEAEEGRNSFLEKRDPDWSAYPWLF